MAKENGSGGRGLTIVLPRGGGYDPMARPGEKPVIRIGSGPYRICPRGTLRGPPRTRSLTSSAEAMTDSSWSTTFRLRVLIAGGVVGGKSTA